MIGNPNWFKVRKYGGWGLTPANWQGWLYLGIMILPFLINQALPIKENVKTTITMVWALILSVDVIDLMIRMKKDERERLHEAIAERNAMWFMVLALVVGVGYQTASGIIKNNWEVDPVIIAALLGAMVTKAVSHWYLRDK